MPLSSTISAISDIVPVIILCFVVVPFCITETGVSKSMPPRASSRHIVLIRLNPIMITIVSTDLARFCHRTDSVSFSGSSCPVTNTTEDE